MCVVSEGLEEQWRSWNKMGCVGMGQGGVGGWCSETL